MPNSRNDMKSTNKRFEHLKMELLVGFYRWAVHKVENLVSDFRTCLQLRNDIILVINLLKTFNWQLEQNSKLFCCHFYFHLGFLYKLKDAFDNVGAPCLHLICINELN